MRTLGSAALAGIGACALAAFPAGALADIQIASFTFSELNASYDAANNAFSAVSSDSGVLQTAGDVTRLAPAGGTANYGPGVAPGMIDINISVENLTATSATGAGSFTILDADGDALIGTIDGQWSTQGFGSVFFTGMLSGVEFIDNGALDGLFNGPSGGAFDMDLPGSGPYTGAFVEIQIVAGGFFTSSYQNVSSLASGTIVPAPGAMALLLGAGVLAAGRRR